MISSMVIFKLLALPQHIIIKDMNNLRKHFLKCISPLFEILL